VAKDATTRFGRELQHRRRKSGLTQRELAERVCYSRETVAAVERGRRYGSQQLAVACDQVLSTGGLLSRLWPEVESEQVAADRRRGPRQIRVPIVEGALRPAG
jgi:transcriptional regulator with XRE-family HTH domain